MHLFVINVRRKDVNGLYVPPLVHSRTRRPRHATEEELRYILQIQGVLNNTSDLEEKRILINNINEELRGTEVSLASNKKSSFVIQSILESCSRDQIRLFLSYSKGKIGISFIMM